MQRKIYVAIKGLLPKHMCKALIDMTNTFRVLCFQELHMSVLLKMKSQLPKTMCNLDRIFPPSFFNITVHRIAHLAEEAKVTGVVQYHWMHSIERLVNFIEWLNIYLTIICIIFYMLF